MLTCTMFMYVITLLIVFMSDCSAVANFMKNGYATNSTDASAKALNAGMDVYGGWGDHLWEQGYLHKAITDGQTTEAILNQAMMRTTIQKMKVGAFDPLEVSKLLAKPKEIQSHTFSLAFLKFPRAIMASCVFSF